MSDQKFTDVNSLGKYGIIDRLSQGATLRYEETLLGIGDDAAIISESDGKYQLISSEIFIEDIHFDPIYSELKHVGYKFVVATISDILAMNGKPKQLLSNIAISSKYTVEAVDALYEGIHAACNDYGVDLVGGDFTSSNKGLAASLTCVGEVDKQKLTTRNGAKPGDLIVITGDLGAAYLGLQILEREKKIFKEDNKVKPDFGSRPYLLQRYLRPVARVDVINWLHGNGVTPTSMIDISQGLTTEIYHIARQSQTGIMIEEPHVPIHTDTEMQALDFKIDPTTAALYGGEDYELLMTIRPQDFEKVQYADSLYIIGEVMEKDYGVKLHSSGGKLHDLKALGWPADR